MLRKANKMKRFYSCLTMLSLILVLICQNAETVRASNPSLVQNSTIKVIESTSHDLVLELTVPTAQFRNMVSDQGPCEAINIPGWGLSGEPGEPALPVKGTLVGLPLVSSPKVTVLETGPLVVQNGINLCPAATAIHPEDTTNAKSDLSEKLVVNTAAYASDQNFPGGFTFIDSSSMIRSQQVAQVLFQPYQYNPANHKLTTTNRIRIQVEFGTTTDLQSESVVVDEGPFESILKDQVINYEAARTWRARPSIQPESIPSYLFANPAYKILITQDGMVRIPYTQLIAAGIPVDSIDPRNIHIYNQNSEISILIQGESDGVFDSGDSIIFYGQKINTRFTDTNVYWLTWDNVVGLRMASTDGSPAGGSTPTTFTATVHSEENHMYVSNYPSGLDQNHWYWSLINPPGTRLISFDIPLTNVNTTASTARLRGFFKGYSASPQHHTHISINGNLISQAFWPARNEFSFNVVFPQSYLHEGNNTIEVEAPLTDGISVNQILVDWFEIDYSKNYSANSGQTIFSGGSIGAWKYRLTGLPSNDFLTWDITDVRHPMVIDHTSFESQGGSFDLVFQQSIAAKHEYLATSPGNILAPASITRSEAVDLHASPIGADYIIITHPDFASGILPLETFYTERGLRVKTINVNDIYDEFSYGVVDPAAIHDFLAYAYTNWPRPAPSYVLLVGDGNYDFKNFYKRNETVFIPPYLANVDPWLGETAADNRYVTVSGADILPDMALGRLPVQTLAETNAAVAKILDHYQNILGDWTNRALFVAGNNDPAAGNFAALSDAVVNNYLMPQNVPVDKVYYMYPPFTNGLTARQAVADAINNGRGLVHFTGHSNPYAWFGDTNVSNAMSTVMLDQTTVQGLSNAGKYPTVISMTCYTGYFIIPGVSVLDETLIRGDSNGAVATWSPAGEGVASGHDLLDAGFFQAIYQNNASTIGIATNQAKYYLYANSNGLHRELIDTYILFGDPAMIYQKAPTAVDLNFFKSQAAFTGVELAWETVSEVDTIGFNLYRRGPAEEYVKLNADYIPSNMGGQPQGNNYTYLDTSVERGKAYEYKLDVISPSLQVVKSTSLTTSWAYMFALPIVKR
jgi:hypothetical protein